MIDLTHVKSVLKEANGIIPWVDGVDLDETDAITSQSKGKARHQRAQTSQHLQLLATRLELAAALVRNEYWVARGEIDPLQPELGHGRERQ